MTHENAKIIADYLLSQIEQEYAITKKVLEAVPSDNTEYKPSEKCMSGLGLATHIAVAEAFFLRGVVNGKLEWTPLEFATPADAAKYFEETIPALIAQARALPAAKLLENMELGPMKMPALDFLSLNLRHSVHHRGQLSAYLRPMGAKVPNIYGPSGDTEKAAAH